jgi:N-acetylneuraminic acid mutarotase
MKKKSTSQSAPAHRSLGEGGFFNLRVLVAVVVCLAGVLLALFGVGAFSSAFAQGKGSQNNRSTTNQAAPGTQTPDVVRMVGPVRLDQDLRSLPYIPPAERIEEERRLTRFPLPETGAPPLKDNSSPWLRSLLRGLFRPTSTMPLPLLTFEGMNETDACGTCEPPDTDGDVGPNHYIEALNSAFRVFDKSGNPLTPVITFNSFFASLLGTPCGAPGYNRGDPFVFYDQMADRWVVTDFAFCDVPPFYECIGVSQTGDPVSGGWYFYALQHDPLHPERLGDYPKFGLWPDAYYLTVNEYTNRVFNAVRVYALDRASMISGGPANAIGFTIDPIGLGDSFSLVPASFRTGDPPPAGEQEFLLAINARPNVTSTQVHGWLFHADFVNPGNSTLGIGANHRANAEITVNGFVDAVTTTEFLVPQRDSSALLDTLGERMMTPVVYQNRNGTESLWADHTILLNHPNGPTAVRWYQLDVTGGSFPTAPVQQQDWSNGNDGLWRWMPSIAVDQNGNTAIGYSTSGDSIFPSIRYAGRFATDPLNNLGQGEAIMTNGSQSQIGRNRWGDYTMTTIDPTDGMSFWHVNEYYRRTPTRWRTRVGKFNFAGGPTPTPTPDCNWSDGPPNLPGLKRAVGVYFPDGNFYAMGGRRSDTPGSDFPEVYRYSPSSNSWNLMGADLPDNQVSDMACGVLAVSGTPYIYCVGGSAVGQTTATARVFFYDPVADTVTTLTAADNWPGDAAGTILPGGFAVVNNKLYILGGFNLNVASTSQIWQFDPTAATGSKWTQMVNTPEGIMYAPTCAINGIIYVAGASDYSGGSVIDTTNSFSFNPFTNSIGTIAAIPRATGQTRALAFNDGLGVKMYVMGGGQVPPNPSNEVDVYNPATNTWAIGESFDHARRNFPTDTNGTDHIWVWGGYTIPEQDSDTLEIFSCRPTPNPRPRPTPTPRWRPTPSSRPSPL